MVISHLFLLSLFIFSSPLPSSSTSIFPEFARPTKSGYLPVKASPSPSLFYAFYEAQEPVSPLSGTPLLLWLEGGPGASSMLANFFHFGPWLISPKDNLVRFSTNFCIFYKFVLESCFNKLKGICTRFIFKFDDQPESHIESLSELFGFI